jgi:hypothetical protein
MASILLVSTYIWLSNLKNRPRKLTTHVAMMCAMIWLSNLNNRPRKLTTPMTMLCGGMASILLATMVIWLSNLNNLYCRPWNNNASHMTTNCGSRMASILLVGMTIWLSNLNNRPRKLATHMPMMCGGMASILSATMAIQLSNLNNLNCRPWKLATHMTTICGRMASILLASTMIWLGPRKIVTHMAMIRASARRMAGILLASIDLVTTMHTGTTKIRWKQHKGT